MHKLLASSKLFILALFSLGLLSQSCITMTMVNREKEIQLNVEQENVKIERLINGFRVASYTEVEEPYQIWASASKYKFIPVQVSGKGFIPKTVVLERTKKNFIPLIASGVYAIGAIAAVNSTEDYETGLAVALPLGVASLGSLTLARKGDIHLYEKEYDIPTLDSIPTWKPGMQAIGIEQVNVKIDAGQHKRLYFSDYEAFTNGNYNRESISNTDIDVENTYFEGRLNYLLGKTGFSDTTLKIYSSRFSFGTITTEIIEFKEFYVGNHVMIELASRWTLTNTLTKEEIKSSYMRKTSFWNYQYATDSETIQKMVDYSLELSLYDFLGKSRVTEFLNNPKNPMDSIFNAWETLKMDTSSSPVDNFDDAFDATATIKVADGHGSGFFISADGYLVTNHHVIEGNDSAEIKVFLGESEPLTATVVRSNPIFDLALLKVDTNNLNFLRPGINREVKKGTEVFAIGTPRHMDLYKTVSAGIISSNREDQGKKVIQSDVKINLGNSGGPMILENGDLLGIVNAKLIGTGIEGISFAIPAYYISEMLKIELN